MTTAPPDLSAATTAMRALATHMSPVQAEEAIVGLVTPWAGSTEAARGWFSETVIPGFGLTPEALVHTGRTGLLVDYIHRIAQGGYA